MSTNEAKAREMIAEMTLEELVHFQEALLDAQDDAEFSTLKGRAVWAKCMMMVTEQMLKKVN